MTDTSSGSKPHFHLFLDESHYLFDFNDDSVKEQLREIDGVPNATYVVQGESVFVFEKLVTLVKQHAVPLSSPDKEVTRQAVLALMPQAWTPPMSAVTEWGILPEPYELHEGDSGYDIRHRAFRATVPAQFTTKGDAQRALAHMLVGGIVHGQGDFAYRDQPLKLLAPFSLDSLPPPPAFDVTGLEKDLWSHSWLKAYDHIEGFGPLTKDVFDTLKARELSWVDESGAARKYARSHPDVWSIAADLPFFMLNAGSVGDGAEQPETQGLRGCYPELSALSGAALFDQFNGYMTDSGYRGDWEPSRENGFLLYLLGKLPFLGVVDMVVGLMGGADNGLDDKLPAGSSAVEVGEMAAFALLRGKPLAEAFAFAKAWGEYNSALLTLTRWTHNVLYFLREEAKKPDLRGSKIRTMGDVFRMGRKVFSPVVVKQTLADFNKPL